MPWLAQTFKSQDKLDIKLLKGRIAKQGHVLASPYSEIQFVVYILSSLLCFLHLQMLVSGNAHDQANARKTITVVAKFV
jgi:hypothetical protein